MEKFLALNQKIFCTFVDLEKVFDKVDRNMLWEELPNYEVSDHLLRAVKSLFNSNRACVRVESDVSPWFKVCIGVKQGCVMFRWLFNYLDSCLAKMKEYRDGVKLIDQVVNSLLYADDAVPMSESESE